MERAGKDNVGVKKLKTVNGAQKDSTSSVVLNDSEPTKIDAKKKKNKKKTKKGTDVIVGVPETKPAPQDEEEEEEEEDDIDNIFADVASKVAAKVAAAKKVRKPEVHVQPKDDDFFDSRGKNAQKRKKIEGVSVYSLDELGVGKGGETDLCPFDCTCCH